MLKYYHLLLILLFSTLTSTSTFAQNDSMIFDAAFYPPSFVGGNDSMNAFIVRNFQYPETALNDYVSGKVIVEYIIEKDGSLSNIKVKQGVREDLNNEAMRLFQIMPAWKPGKNLKEEYIRVRQTFPIYFRLEY